MIMKYYFINKFETNNIDKLDKQTAVIYRNYNSKVLDKELILNLKRYCKKNGIKFYLSNNVKIAIKLDLDGAYIPSFNKSTNHLAFSLKKKFNDSPLNNFLKIPETVIDNIATYNKRWFIFANSFCPKNLLRSIFGTGLKKLFNNLKITK